MDNFEPLIAKIKNITKIWNRRNVSILGRIHIAKSMCISQIIHCLSMIATPDEKYLDEINKAIFGYIWKGGRDRIKRKILIGPYDLGGLNAPDVYTLAKSLLLKWIQRLFDNTDTTWKALVKHNLPHIELTHLFECNLHQENIKDIYSGSTENVWYHVLKYWCKYNYEPNPETKVDIINQPIYFNSKIVINRKTIFRIRWYRKGVLYISDLLEEDQKRFLKLEQFNDKFNLNENFLTYYQTLQAIPKKWRYQIKTDESKNVEYVHKIQTLLGSKHRDIYRSLVARKCELPVERYHKWLQDLQVRIEKIDVVDWVESYASCFRLTESRKLRSFEYHLRMRDIMSNTKLYSMGLVTDESCRECKTREDLMHLLWHCPVAQSLWFELKKWIYNVCKYNMALLPVYIIFSLEVSKAECTPDIVWLIILICKQYLYQAKCLDKKPTFTELKGKITEIENIEYRIAYNSKRLHLHYDKWSSFAVRRQDEVFIDRNEDAVFI